MARVEHGHLDGHAPVVSTDEIGSVAEGFNRMLHGLREREMVKETFGKYIYHNVETRQPVQIITSLPEMLTAFETIDRLAGSAKLVVAGHDPQVADRFKPVEPGIIKIA